MTETVIVSAVRTPIGNLGGILKDYSAVELGAFVIRAVVKECGLTGSEIDEVIMGNVVAAGLGQIPARQAAISAGLPVEVPALSINKVCGSALRAVSLAHNQIQLGEAEVVLAGGMESMSGAPHLVENARWGQKLGHQNLEDALLRDGLWCPIRDLHMGNHGEELAGEYGVTRMAQDRWALRSHRRAVKAAEEGLFTEEIVPLPNPRGGGPLNRDQSPRPDTSLQALSSLPPVFSREGSITAGNAPGINDGAGVLLLMSASRAQEMGLEPLARVVATGMAATSPEKIGLVPALAAREVMEKSQLDLERMDRVEINEAFAAVVLICNKVLDLDPELVNVNGGAVALGHPIGMSGARILGTLVYELRREKLQYGLATICSGTAQGDAIIVENLQL